MPLINLIVTIVVLGVVWYLLTTFVPLPQPVKVVIGAIFALLVIILILESFGFTSLWFPVRHR